MTEKSNDQLSAYFENDPGLSCLNLKLSVSPYTIPQCICHNLSWKAQLTLAWYTHGGLFATPAGKTERMSNPALHEIITPAICTVMLPSSRRFCLVCRLPIHKHLRLLLSFLNCLLFLSHTHEHGRNTMFPTGRIYSYVLQLQIQGCHQKPNKIHQ